MSDTHAAGEVPSNDLYRSVSGPSPAVILIADTDDPREAFSGLAGLMESRGCRVYTESWGGVSETAPTGRRGRTGPTTGQRLLARIDSLVGAHAEVEWAIGAAGRGCGMAAAAAAGARRPPVCIFLVSPMPKDEDHALAPAFSVLDLPLLIIATRAAPGASEAHLDLYVETRRRSELWTLGGAVRGASLLHSRDHLAVDVAEWVCGRLMVARPGPAGDAPALQGVSRTESR